MKNQAKWIGTLIMTVILLQSCPSSIMYNDYPNIPDLNSEDDLGYSDSDNITSRTEGLRFAVGADDGAKVELWDESTLLSSSVSQNGKAAFSVTLSAGKHYLKSRIVFEDGAASSFTEPSVVIIDDSRPDGIPSIEKPFPWEELGNNSRPRFEWDFPLAHEFVQLQVDNDIGFSGPEIDEPYLNSFYYVPRTNLPMDPADPRGTTYYCRLRFVDIAGNYGDWTDSSEGVFLVGHRINDINADSFSDLLIGSSGWLDVFFGGSVIDTYSEISVPGSGSFGVALAALGDLNSDGYGDFAIGAPNYSPNYRGIAYIYLGKDVAELGTPLTSAGEADNSNFGISVSPGFDINGDGYDDLIIGASGYNSGQGRAYIFFGGASFDAEVDITLSGETLGDNFGISVAGIGDYNGDGFDDVVVGSPGYDSSRGRVYMYYGGPAMDAIADLTITGENPSDFFGKSISKAGDLNRDGYSDFIVGAYGFSGNTGRAYIYKGGISQSVLPQLILDGEQGNSYFGWAVSGGVDENGDGFPDIVIGAYGYNSQMGRAYIYRGGNSMKSLPDLILSGQTYSSQFGFSVGAIGDINGDGYGDLAVGAPQYSSYLGRAFIYYGGSAMNNIPDIVLTGQTAGQRFGYSIGR
ncbi:MAG: FG-GAP repeat protein [Spirochaetes bacterium]|nr:FG-GAP repeat protein [Spirochaetota bacterium]MBU1080183.1 FG-GAP repeat protein [Spirochaetota bacterium]